MKLGLIFGAAAAFGAFGFAVAACSSGGTMFDDGGLPDTATPKDSGVGTDTGMGNDTGSMGNDGGDGGVDCGTTATLHPSDGGLYCPFSAVDGGANAYCIPNVQHCCEPAMGTSTCKPIASACAMTDTDWQCEDKTDCPNNMQCCGIGKPGGPDPGCVNLFATGFKGSHCAASCMQGSEFIICESSSECPNNQTCKPAKLKGNQVGICQ